MSLDMTRRAHKKTELPSVYYWFRRRVPMFVATTITVVSFLLLQAILPVASLTPALAWSIVILGAQTGFLGFLAKVGVLSAIAIVSYKLQTSLFKISYFTSLEKRYEERGTLLETLKARWNEKKQAKKRNRTALQKIVMELKTQVAKLQNEPVVPLQPIEVDEPLIQNPKLKRSEQDAILPSWYPVFRHTVPLWSAGFVALIGFLFLNAFLPITMLPPAVAWSIVILGAQTGIMGFLAKGLVLGGLAALTYKVETGLFKLFAFNMLDNKFQARGAILKSLIHFAEKEKEEKNTAEQSMKEMVNTLSVQVKILEHQPRTVRFAAEGAASSSKDLRETIVSLNLSSDEVGDSIIGAGNSFQH